MYPFLFKNEHLPMYGILLAVGLLAAVLLYKLICAKKKVDDNTYTFYSLLAIISIAAGLGGAFLFQAMYNAIYNAVNHLTGTARETGGLTFMGGLVTGVTVFVLGTLFFAKGQVKRNFFRCASYAAPCIVIGHMFGRLGCFCAGCCYGKPTNSPLGIVFPDLRDYPHWYPEYVPTGGRAYPTQLFEAIFLAVLLAVMLVLLFKFDNHKIMLPLYGISYAVFRFCIEFLRGDYRGTVTKITPSQIQVIVLCAVAIALAVLVYKFDIIPFAHAKDPAPKANAPQNDTSVAADTADSASQTPPDTTASAPQDSPDGEPADK